MFWIEIKEKKEKKSKNFLVLFMMINLKAIFLQDSNIILKCLCSFQGPHLLEYLQKRKHKREVNKGEVVERLE